MIRKRGKSLLYSFEDASSHYKMFCALFVRSYLITVHLRKMQILQSLSFCAVYSRTCSYLYEYDNNNNNNNNNFIYIFFTVTAYMKFYFHIWISCFMMVLHHTTAFGILLASHKSDSTELNSLLWGWLVGGWLKLNFKADF